MTTRSEIKTENVRFLGFRDMSDIKEVDVTEFKVYV